MLIGIPENETMTQINMFDCEQNTNLICAFFGIRFIACATYVEKHCVSFNTCTKVFQMGPTLSSLSTIKVHQVSWFKFIVPKYSPFKKMIKE